MPPPRRRIDFPLHARRDWPLPRDQEVLRLGCYNIQVDHDRDSGTQREWCHRRPLAAAAVTALDCDVIMIQEPGPPAAADLQADLSSSGFRVAACACDPSKWEDAAGPKSGQAYDGNGFIWREARMELLGELSPFWFSEAPDAPGGGKWDGSPYERTGVQARFRDKLTGQLWHFITVHLDHAGNETRKESARLAIQYAAAAMQPDTAVVVGGDFNTFPEPGDETYDTLATAGQVAGMVDVRAAADVEIYDFGVGGCSWKGWPGEKFCREENVANFGSSQDASRFDQLFVQANAKVRSTGVVEEACWADASDHVPIVTEFLSTQ